MNEHCNLSGSYMPLNAFNGLLPFKGNLGWLPLNKPVQCLADIEIGGSGGGGASAWEDHAVIHKGDIITLIWLGDPWTPSRVQITRG